MKHLENPFETGFTGVFDFLLCGCKSTVFTIWTHIVHIAFIYLC